MKVKVLLVMLVVAGLLFAGCSGSPPSSGGGGATTPTTTTTVSGGEGGEQSENPYDTASEVSPPPDATEIHNMIKPILESAFGGAKLTSYYAGQSTGGQGLVLVYVVKEPIDAGKVQSVVDSLKSMGYSSAMWGGVSEDSVGYALQKDNEVIMIGGTIGEHEITVTWGKS